MLVYHLDWYFITKSVLEFLIVCKLIITPLKGNYKSNTSYSRIRVLNLLENDVCIAEISQAILELLRSKVETGNPHGSRKLSFSDFSNSPLVAKMT